MGTYTDQGDPCAKRNSRKIRKPKGPASVGGKILPKWSDGGGIPPPLPPCQNVTAALRGEDSPVVNILGSVSKPPRPPHTRATHTIHTGTKSTIPTNARTDEGAYLRILTLTAASTLEAHRPARYLINHLNKKKKVVYPGQQV